MIPQYEFYQALRIALSMVPDTCGKYPPLASLLVECSDVTELRLVGSDGERIVVVALEVAHGQPVGTTLQLIPTEARSMMDTFQPTSPESRMTVCFMGNTLMVTNGAEVAACNVIPPDPYPDYRGIMEHSNPIAEQPAFSLSDLSDALAVLDGRATRVRIAVNGLYRPCYLEAELVEGLTAIKSVRMGFSPQGAARPEAVGSGKKGKGKK